MEKSILFSFLALPIITHVAQERRVIAHVCHLVAVEDLSPILGNTIPVSIHAPDCHVADGLCFLDGLADHFRRNMIAINKQCNLSTSGTPSWFLVIHATFQKTETKTFLAFCDSFCIEHLFQV
jgi:hypothetical protein